MKNFLARLFQMSGPTRVIAGAVSGAAQSADAHGPSPSKLLLDVLIAENAQLRAQQAELHRALMAVYDRGAHAQGAQVEAMLRQAAQVQPPIANVVPTAPHSEEPANA